MCLLVESLLSTSVAYDTIIGTVLTTQHFDYSTPQSIQRDRAIFNKPFKRWYIALAAMVFQAICGSVYA